MLITSTVETEWAEHRLTERDKVEKALENARKVINDFRETCRRCGLRPPARLSPRYDLIPVHLSQIAERLFDVATLIEDDPQCQLRAFARLRSKLPPATAGGQIKDCEIIEHYLAFCEMQRQRSFNQRCVFVSSNTSDFCAGKGKLHPNLDFEFTSLDLRFATDLSWGRHEMGIPHR